MIRCGTVGLIWIVLLASAGVRAGEEEAPTVPALGPEDTTELARRTLQLTTAQGEPLGEKVITRGRLAGGEIVYGSVTNSRVTLGRGGSTEVRELEIRCAACFDSRGVLLWVRNEWHEGDASKLLQAGFSHTRTQVQYTAPGINDVTQLDLPARWTTDRQVFQRLLKGFRKGEVATEQYDAINEEAIKTSGVLSSRSMTILGETTLEHGGQTLSAYRVKTDISGFEITSVVDEHFMPMQIDLAGRMKLEWRDETSPPADREVPVRSAAIPMTGLPPTERTLDRLELTASVQGIGEAREELFVSSRYQDVERHGGDYQLVLRGSHPSDAQERLPYPLGSVPEDVSVYLDPTEESQSDNPGILACANELVGSPGTALEATRLIAAWVSRNIELGHGTRMQASAVECLESKVGDCSEHSALTVALCRAVGIPARSVGGVVCFVEGDGTAEAGRHAWVEVWVGGWIGVDTTRPVVGTDARYILLFTETPGRLLSESSHFDWIRTRDLHLRVDGLSYSRRGP